MNATHQAQSLLDSPIRSRTAAAPWIAVTGGKGGVGKTIVAVNLAIAASDAGYRTLLVDLDPGLANIDVHLRLAPRFTIEDLAHGQCSPAEAIVPGPRGVSFLAGRSGSTELASGETEFLNRVHEAIRRASRGYDLVICDTGAGIGPAVLRTIARADLSLVVTTSDLSAATDAYALIKLAVQNGAAPPQLVINRVANRGEAMRSATRLTTVCQKFLNTNLELTGWLHQDRTVERSVARQRPFVIDGRGTPSDDIRSLCGQALSQLPLRRAAAMEA